MISARNGLFSFLLFPVELILTDVKCIDGIFERADGFDGLSSGFLDVGRTRHGGVDAGVKGEEMLGK